MNITSFSSTALLPANDIKFLTNSVNKSFFTKSSFETTLEQINQLHYLGILPSHEALLLKNNLDNLLFAEGVLSEFILHLVQDGKLAPEARSIVSERGFQKTIAFLYTSYLEQSCSTIDPVIIQQRLWKCSPKELLLKMKEGEEMENKKYAKQWLRNLNLSNEEANSKKEILLKPLTDEQFKTHFLELLDLLHLSKEDYSQKLNLEQLYTLLKKEPDSKVYATLSQFLKAVHFYQTHILLMQNMEVLDETKKQFSLCIAADALKNAPFRNELSTFYHLTHGLIQKQCLSSEMKDPILIVKNGSSDEKKASKAIQQILQKQNQSFEVLNLKSLIPSKKHSKRPFSETQLKMVTEQLLKKAPTSLIACSTPETAPLILQAAENIKLPVTFFPSYTNPEAWEDLSYKKYPFFRIAFPTPLNENLPEDINEEKIRISGIPKPSHVTQTRLELKLKWGFFPETKVVVVDTPKGDSPWPAVLAKEYNNFPNLAVVVLTSEQNQAYIHTLKTKVSPKTNLPLSVRTTLTPEEREEFLSLASVIIGKENKENVSLLFETNQARTPLLLDHIPPSIFSYSPKQWAQSIWHFFTSFFLWKQTGTGIKMHEKLLNNYNAGLIIRSPKNFRPAFENLLLEEEPVRNPSEHFTETLPQLIQEMKAESLNPEIQEKSPLTIPLKLLN